MDIFVDYTALVNRIADLFGASHSMMHVHAGLTIYILTQLVLRTRRASMTALNVVVAAAVGHEVLDYLGSATWDAKDTLSDIGLTVMWPVAITAIGQFRRARWQHEQKELARLYIHVDRRSRPAPARIRVGERVAAPLTRKSVEPAD